MDTTRGVNFRMSAIASTWLSIAVMSSTAPARASSAPGDSLSSYLKVPNATTGSKTSANAYLRLMSTEKTPPDVFTQLLELLAEPVWAFDNSDPHLYTRSGRPGNPEKRWWDWNVIMGSAREVSDLMNAEITAACELQNYSSAESHALVGLGVASRLLAGNPDMSQTVLALMWGRAVLDALEECPQVTRITKVQTALRNFADLCTAEPAVEWETKTFPFLHGLASLLTGASSSLALFGVAADGVRSEGQGPKSRARAIIRTKSSPCPGCYFSQAGIPSSIYQCVGKDVPTLRGDTLQDPSRRAIASEGTVGL